MLGFLVFLLRNVFAGKIVGGFTGFVFGLPFAYLFGLPIVLIMWVEDWFLSDKECSQCGYTLLLKYPFEPMPSGQSIGLQRLDAAK